MNDKRILYVQTRGPDAPDRAYAPFILAIAATAAGIHATIYFFLNGVVTLKRSEMEKTNLEGYPSLEQIVDQAVRSGVKLEACEQSCASFGLTKHDLIGQVQIVGAPVLNDRILEADGVLSF